MKRWKSENKGITLVALVVTIIILLILTGVTVYFAVNGGLLGKVEEAVDKSNQAGQNEVNTLNEAAMQIDKYLNGNQQPANRLEYDFDASTGTITGVKNKANYYEEGNGYTSPEGDVVIIPSQIDGVAVKAIGDKVFEFWKMREVRIPNGVTSLGTDCFRWCNNLTQVIIPDTVTTLGSGCFEYDEELATVTIPKSITQIDNYCFSNCRKLTSVNYKGTEQEWNAITKGSGNDNLINANIVYNYAP